MMSLGPSEKSGTPIETRGAAAAAGKSVEQVFSGQDLMSVLQMIGGNVGSLTTSSAQNILGFDPSDIGIEGSAETALGAPRFDVSDLLASLEPFEQREREMLSANVRGSFGTAGGRFSENILSAEGRAQADLSDRFSRRRETLAMGSFEDSERRRIEALGAILPSLTQAGVGGAGVTADILRSLLGFTSPGTPVQDPGIVPGLLEAGSTLGAAAILA